MSPVRTRRWDGLSLVGGGRGTIEEPDDDFLSGINTEGVISTTQPTIPSWDNTGHTGTLTPYTGPNAGGFLIITEPTTFTNIDFGNTRVRINAPNVSFINCRWSVTSCGTDRYDYAQVDFRQAANTGNGYMYKCTIENLANDIRGRNGVLGWNFTAKRCRVRGFIDNFGLYVPGAPGRASDGLESLPLNVDIIDTYIGEVAWCQHPVSGVVHQSDTRTHSDCIQFQGGYGGRLINTTLIAHYSNTVGTGTPNSGSDTGWPTLPYTQAEAEALRYATVQGGGTFATPGVRGYNMGGSLSAIMINTSVDKGYLTNHEIHWGYGQGGAYWINAAANTVTDFSVINHLRVLDDQRITGGGRGMVVAVRSGVNLTMTDAYFANNTTDYASSGIAITRRNA